ncbi:hypothetical protein [Methanomassiliicoccus luminyensis]|uniref:hypothetical protein n=1 Tax=Methanomassiliicoccus luminyensis TaxID=1080712 RepID=UPI000474546D|nr:hypothetical protein [Methanomassiliicoccus luminyensis]
MSSGNKPRSVPSSSRSGGNIIPTSVLVIVCITAITLALILSADPSRQNISASPDADGDGYADAKDVFPYDRTQQFDRDGDGYGDNPSGNNPDKFPNDPSEWADSDSDGIGDNADFYDRGNGKIRIAITGYKGDGTADAVGAGDPYFIIRVDTNNDGIMDLTYTSQVFTDKENLTGPYSVTIDLPDDSKTVRFSISVFDDNNAADRPIDYAPGSATVQTHTVNAPFFGSWTYDGDDDKRKEIDCELSYTISAVG